MAYMAQPQTRLVIEAVVVGAALALALWLVSLLRLRWHPVVTGFVVGAGLHLVFEFTGMNRSYCSTGHACMA